MIKKILVGLDPEEDTLHATDYAIRIASSHDATLTGLAVVDERDIEAAAATELYMYKAPMVREQLGEEARERARELIDRFEETVEASDVTFADTIGEGVPFERIIEDMKYHDLLVIGRNPHFFYHAPEQRTDTLDKVVTQGISPVLVVGESPEPVEKILLAYDGSVPAARSMQQFVQQQPFGDAPSLEIVNVRSGGEKAEKESALLLELAQSYCEAHGFSVSVASVESRGDTGEQILTHAEEIDADLIVAGAHAVTRVQKWVFGSATEHLLAESTFPLYLYH
jgi:nucleotide-binding universal stress UspA family protein